MLWFELGPSASEPCCPTHCPWEPLEFLTKVSEIVELNGSTEIRTQTNFLRFFCHGLTTETFLNKKALAELDWKKIDPTDCVIFL